MFDNSLMAYIIADDDKYLFHDLVEQEALEKIGMTNG
jgi:hypothetical protein